jgi:predicted NAD/FAD-binding protein
MQCSLREICFLCYHGYGTDIALCIFSGGVYDPVQYFFEGSGMEKKNLSIAIVGSGVAGLTAAYLLNKEHTVRVFEKNDYPGGHTHTIVLDKDPDRGTPVDTGFIVMNHRNYPLFTKLLDRLGVTLRDSDMSFGYSCEYTGLQYSSRGFGGFFAQRKNLFSPSVWRMFFDLVKFHRKARHDLVSGGIAGLTLGQYLAKNGFSDIFINHHILPMGGAIWSTPDAGMMEFPAESFLRFFDNHGLLSFTGSPIWRTVVGGSYTYVTAIRNTLKMDVVTGCAVQSVHRENGRVRIKSSGRDDELFDCVVIAAHADDALKLLADPSADEKRLLGAWRYEENNTVLHSDDAVMPTNKNARASWNFLREKKENEQVLSLSYDMNRLQGFNTVRRYFVTLNTHKKIQEKDVVTKMVYHHPSFTFESMKTQSELPTLNGKQNTYFCGSYFGYGFHEDAVRSAVDIAKLFGIEL